MAYGDKRGNKLPGEYRTTDYFGFAMAGAFGIVAATLTDLNQRGDASALYQVSHWAVAASELVGLGQIPLYVVVALLMAVGASSIFFLQPVSMREAFLQGFGVLAVLMTIVPSDLGAALNAPIDELPVPQEAQLQAQAQVAAFMGQAGGESVRTGIQKAVYQPNIDPSMQKTALQPDAGNVGGYNITIEINFPDVLEQDVSEMVRRGTMRGRLYNDSTRKSYNLFRNGGADANLRGNVLVIRASVPGDEATTTLFTRVEAAGYKITLEEFEARQGRNSVWVINMTPSNTPLFIQRLGNSYRF